MKNKSKHGQKTPGVAIGQYLMKGNSWTCVYNQYLRSSSLVLDQSSEVRLGTSHSPFNCFAHLCSPYDVFSIVKPVINFKNNFARQFEKLRDANGFGPTTLCLRGYRSNQYAATFSIIPHIT